MSERLNPIPPNDRFADLYCKKCGEPIPIGQGFCFDCMPKPEPINWQSRALSAEAELKEERTALGYIMLILETNEPMKAVAELKAERDELKALFGRVDGFTSHSIGCDIYEGFGSTLKCTCGLSAILAQIDGIVGEGNV